MPVTSSETQCSTWRRVLTSRNEIDAVLGDQELAGAGADVAGLAQDRLATTRRARSACSSVRNGAGASSTSFWLRRWSEQSRVETTTTLPCWSARHWVSTCRGLSRNFSTRHSPRPNALTASRTADSKASGISSSVRATLRPRPPPPKTALIATGRPFSSANATTSSASLTGSLVPGASGALACAGDVLGPGLVAERLDRRRRRADPDQPGVDHGLGELGVLGEEAVAGVHRVGAGPAPRPR